MSNISPKVIDVDGNRVETDDIINSCELVDFRGETTLVSCNKNPRTTIKDGRIYIPNDNGRFPTQLFCNIKNNQFKYVKYIT